MAYHILNGDMLLEQMPDDLAGERIVMRECLVEGPVDGDSMGDFYATRAAFIEAHYGDGDTKGYYKHVVPEFEKIQALPAGSEVYLWFEDDLYCQVNCWFVVSLLQGQRLDLRLVRPPKHTHYGFGGFTPAGLRALFAQAVPLDHQANIALLWQHYQNGDANKLRQTAESLSGTYPFMLRAVEAHMARFPKGGQPGRPVAALKQIMADLNTNKFGPVFQEFSKRESIYGFGDLQVKRLYDQIIDNRDDD